MSASKIFKRRAHRTVRRLHNLRTDRISLVDKAAIGHPFAIIKRDESVDGEGKMEELLKRVEKALNKLADACEPIADLKKSIDDLMDKFEKGDEVVEKAGAKFSSANLARLKSIRDAITGLLGDTATAADDVKKGKEGDGKGDEGDITFEEGLKKFESALKTELKPEEKGKEANTELVKTVTEAFSGVVAKLLDQKKAALTN